MLERAIIVPRSELVCSGAESLDQGWACLQQGMESLSHFESFRYGALPDQVLEQLEALSRERLMQHHDYAALLPVLLGRRLLSVTEIDRKRCLGIVGSSRGLSQRLHDAYQRYFLGEPLMPKTSPQTTAGTISSLFARSLKLEGLNFSVSAACSSGLHAIGIACSLLRSGVADYAIAGGSEYAANDFSFKMLNAA